MTYYNKSTTTNANIDVRTSENPSILSLLLSLPVALWQFLCALGIRRVVKGASLTFCVFAFLGIIGGIEAGLITFGFGAVLTVLLIVIEIICLRK